MHPRPDDAKAELVDTDEYKKYTAQYEALEKEGTELQKLALDATAKAIKAQEQMKSIFTNGITFRMKDTDRISLRFKDLEDWIIAATSSTAFQWPASVGAMLGQAVEALDKIAVDLWGLSFDTKSHRFEFKMLVTFDTGFLDSMNVPPELTNIFDVKSMGVGVSFYPTPSAADAS